MLNQGILPNQEVLHRLQQQGQTIERLILNEAVDALMTKLPNLCPHLSTLAVNERLNYQLGGRFTDESLNSIGKLTKITHLELDLWLNMMITPIGVQTLLGQSNWSYLKLSMASKITDGTLETLSQSQQLKSFHLKSSAPLTASGIETFVSSKRIKKSLTDLHLNLNNGLGGLQITGKAALHISRMTQLKKLALAGEWKAQASDVGDMIGGLKQLEKLKLAFPVTPFILASLAASVKSLHLEDASKLSASDYGALLQGRSFSKLTLGNAINFQDGSMPSLSSLTCLTLKKAALEHARFQTRLVKLCLTDSNVSPKSLELNGLAMLTKLKIDNCRHLNDAPFRKIIDTVKLTLVSLELSHVYVSDVLLPKLGKLKNLKKLKLGHLRAVTKKGLENMLGTRGIRENIEDLKLIDLKLSKAAINNLAALMAIHSLAIVDGWSSVKKATYFKTTIVPLIKRNVYIQTEEKQ